MSNFYIGQIIENEYPPEAAEFCNKSNCHIDEIELINGIRRFQIVENEKPSEKEINQQRIIKLESYLSSTDWYAVRYAETDEPIPEEVRKKRAEAREEISRLRKELEKL